MGFFDDLGNGIKDTFSGAYDRMKGIGEKGYNMVNNNLNRMDRIGAAGERIVDGAANVAEGIGSFLSGNSNILLYIGVIAIGVVVVPKLVDKFM
jgi:hypothetical protein